MKTDNAFGRVSTQSVSSRANKGKSAADTILIKSQQQLRKCLLLWMTTNLLFLSRTTHGFSVAPRISASTRSSSATTTRIFDQLQEEETAVAGPSVWDWNYAAGSIGSMLLRMQKEEEELRKTNQSMENSSFALLQSQAVELDALNTSRAVHADDDYDDVASMMTMVPPLQQQQREIRTMDKEAVKELDDAVTLLSAGPVTTLTQGIQIRALPTEYLALQTVGIDTLSETRLPNATTEQMTRPRRQPRLQLARRRRRPASQPLVDDSTATTKTATTTADIPRATMPLSLPEHYRDRISRDMRHLAVSIASSVEDVSQWRLFCQEKGGILPLLESIKSGASALREQEKLQRDPSLPPSSAAAWATDEESFLVASSACRAIRDICAISPEVAVVITDCILRVNAAWLKEGHSLMADFVTLLQHGQDFEEEERSARRRWYSLRRRSNQNGENSARRHKTMFGLQVRRHKREARLRCKLYVSQLLLAMVVSSDDAVDTIRSTDGLKEAVLACSSYCRSEQTQRWLRYPGKMALWLWRRFRRDMNIGESPTTRRPFIEAAAVSGDLAGQVQGTANQVLAAIGFNQWVPKIPGQKGLRLLVLDGGGSRGLASITIVNAIVEELGIEVSDSFDMIAGTSTGGIIAFLVGLLRESSKHALIRYNQLIKQIFVKSALMGPLMLLTTASYDETPFMSILSDILGESIMLDSRADPAVPLVFCVTSKMSSTPTHIALFRNYNYAGGELNDPFVVDPQYAREDLGLPLELEHEILRTSSPNRRSQPKERMQGTKLSNQSSRHPGSCRVLQRYALRASTAAPTVFKPVLMGGEMYCDGGIVASNPAAVAIHEARTLYPHVPIELVVSIGTGGFTEQKSAPRIGWDGIIGQIVNSACDGEQVHHILEDILGEGGTARLGKSSVSKTKYYRLNPVVGSPDSFPIDVSDPEKLARLTQITKDYLQEPEQQRKIKEICDILEGGRRWRWPWQS